MNAPKSVARTQRVKTYKLVPYIFLSCPVIISFMGKYILLIKPAEGYILVNCSKLWSGCGAIYQYKNRQKCHIFTNSYNGRYIVVLFKLMSRSCLFMSILVCTVCIKSIDTLLLHELMYLKTNPFQ